MKAMEQEEKRIYMTTAPVPRLIVTLAVPTIISMLISSFYNMADTFFVGKIDTQATGAVGVSFSIMAIIQALGFLFGHGSGNYVSRRLGSGDVEDAAVMASTGFFMSVLCGFVVMAVGLVFLNPLALLLGSTKTILPYTVKYLRIILLGAPFMTGAFTLNNQLRFQGNASYAMVGIVVGAVLNIALDPLFIFTFRMGISGAALATSLSQAVSFFVLLICCRLSKGVQLKLSSVRPSFYYLFEIFKGGFPSLCRQGLACVATILLNRASRIYGDAAIAGMSIVTRIVMFINSALIGFGQGFQPVCGFNYGAKLYKRVTDGMWFCVKYGTLFLVIVSAAAWIFAPEITAVFRKGDPDVIKTASSALRYQMALFPLNAWTITCNMMMQAIGKPVRASIVAAARQGLFFIPLILVLPYIAGFDGIMMCQMIADGLSFLLAVPLGISVISEMKKEEINKKVIN